MNTSPSWEQELRARSSRAAVPTIEIDLDRVLVEAARRRHRRALAVSTVVVAGLAGAGVLTPVVLERGGDDPTRSPDPAASSSEGTGQVDPPPMGSDLRILTRDASDVAVRAARIDGTLVVADNGCIALRTRGDRGTIGVEWPAGWQVRSDGGRATLFDEAGRVFAAEGDQVALAGGLLDRPPEDPCALDRTWAAGVEVPTPGGQDADELEAELSAELGRDIDLDDIYEGFADVDSNALGEFYHGELLPLVADYPEAAGAPWFDESSGRIVVRVKDSPSAEAYRTAVGLLPDPPAPLAFEETQYTLAQLTSLEAPYSWAGELASEIRNVLVDQLNEEVTIYVKAHPDEIGSLAFEHSGVVAEVVQTDGPVFRPN